MIIDTSAIIGVLRSEDESERIAEALASTSDLRISAATYVELFAVLSRSRDHTIAARRLLDDLGVTVEPFDHAQAKIASSAYVQYGRGSGHRAGLNLGDTYSYALAWITGQELLFVGDDFSHTDVIPALRQVSGS